MNDNTLVAVFGYAGDAHQIEILMEAHEAHQRPIVIMSPEDSPIEKMGPHLCRPIGKRAYVGQASLDRQYEQMLAIYRDYPFAYYLFHDSDSFCLNPVLPPYLYAKENALVMWSNEVHDHRVPGQPDENNNIVPADYHAGMPRIAMQPPYFMTRAVLGKLLRFGRQVADPLTPFIDWYMVQITYAASLRHDKFQRAACFSTASEDHVRLMERAVLEGAEIIHSVKTKQVYERLKAAYRSIHP